ncbi:MAG: polyphosphate polymerase domain-containing protein [Paludibacteraceae bacterium]|nr:polyphosphate polymerase domain-containing protein [Paludibacteraceae bacterium]
MDLITLDEMGGIKLMNRVDTKYVISADRLSEVLLHAQSDYRVQEVDGIRLARYDTLYYDTLACDMYLRHHDRQLRRQKIRTRCYCDSNLWFLEVKNKTNTGRTKKKRIAIDEETFRHPEASAEAVHFLKQRSEYPVEALTPHLRTRFYRITLVNRQQTERLTIDLDLHFENQRSQMAAQVEKLVVIELKQDGRCPSQMKTALQEMRIKPFKMSKYCIGTALTRSDIKSNRFKGKIRRICKLCQQSVSLQSELDTKTLS